MNVKRVLDGSFHKNFEIHVKSSLNRDNQRSNKDKIPYFETPLRSKHQPHCRLIWYRFHKNFEFHVCELQTMCSNANCQFDHHLVTFILSLWDRQDTGVLQM